MPPKSSKPITGHEVEVEPEVEAEVEHEAEVEPEVEHEAEEVEPEVEAEAELGMRPLGPVPFHPLELGEVRPFVNCIPLYPAPRCRQVLLSPDSDGPEHNPILLDDVPEEEVTIIAEVVEVLPGQRNDDTLVG